MLVDFYFCVSSRYSYLASTQLDGISARTGCTFLWKPVHYDVLLAKAGGDPLASDKPASGQYAWTYRQQDARAWAEFYSVPYEEPRDFRVDPPWLVRGCFAADMCGSLIPFCQRIFRAIFVESRVLEEPDLLEFASDVGIDKDKFEEALTNAKTVERQTEVLGEAVSKGVFGVPTFVVEDTLFWGNDRLVLLEHKLKSAIG